MKFFKNSATYITILLILFACFADETEARRRVLRGRRTVTRKYYHGLSIPGWAIIVLVALCELVIGAGLYIAMRKVILSSKVETSNTYTPAMTEEA